MLAVTEALLGWGGGRGAVAAGDDASMTGAAASQPAAAQRNHHKLSRKSNPAILNPASTTASQSAAFKTHTPQQASSQYRHGSNSAARTMASSLARGLGFFSVPADLSGKLAVVTGGNSGIGLEVVKSLAARNATVRLCFGWLAGCVCVLCAGGGAFFVRVARSAWQSALLLLLALLACPLLGTHRPNKSLLTLSTTGDHRIA